MSNIIHVTACDNELIILVYQWGGTREICRILSGNNNLVDVSIEIVAGEYEGTRVLHGIDKPLQESIVTGLVPGEYQLLLLGVDWGGPQAFSAIVNDQAYISDPKDEGDGLVWYTPPITITVD
jgi:hypothetical protein